MFSLTRLLAATLVFTAPVVHAWWDGGHKVVAYLAYDHLNAEERQWVMDLITAAPTHQELFLDKIKEELPAGCDEETRQRWYFGQASVWADLVRNKNGYANAEAISEKHSLPERHYTDLPVFTSEAARQALKAHDVEPAYTWQPGMREPEQMLNSMQTFAKIYAEVPDPKAPVEERAVDLLWLFHLVGDTHQPCHCAQLFDPEKLPEGDRGANGIQIFGLKSKAVGMYSDTLHAFWDSLFNGETNTHADIVARVQALKAKPALWENARLAVSFKAPIDWLREGHALAKTHVYSPVLLQRIARARVETFTRSSRTLGVRKESIVMASMPDAALNDYVAQARKLGDQQAVNGGLRLAGAIKDLRAAYLKAAAAP